MAASDLLTSPHRDRPPVRSRIGRQQRTVLHGASYGDLVGAKLIETYAKNPDGSFNFDATAER